MKLSFRPLWIFVIALVLLVYTACRKADQISEQQNDTPKTSLVEDRFFNLNRTNDPTEKVLVEFIKQRNSKEHFVEQTVKQIGYPRWDKAVKTNSLSKIMGRGNSDSSLATYYIPFVRDSQNHVNAAMAIETTPLDTSFSYLCDWQYSEQLNDLTNPTDSAEHFALFFMSFDKTVFGHTKFIITDTNLFRSATRKPEYVILGDSSATSGKGNYYLPNGDWCEYVSFYYQDCEYEGYPECTPNCDQCSLCMESVSYTVCWTPEGSGGSGGSGGGSGGTGSGGGGTPPDCQPVVERSANANPNCEPGWNPDPTLINYLTNTLGLTPTQINFLNQNPSHQYQIFNFFSQNFSYQSSEICREHINLMISDVTYLIFVNNHTTTGNHSIVWWMDDIWLDNPQYFNLDPYDDYRKLTAAEKALVKRHPTAAFIINQFNRPMANNFTVQKFGSNGLNDKSDAFRHAFFQAVNTLRIGASLTQQFSDAHETEVPSQLIKEKQMDTINNNIGIAYGQTQSYPASTPAMIANAVYTKVLNGELRYLSPIWVPKYSPSGQLINPSGDPNFYGTNGTNNPANATHGITASTLLIPTNQ